MGVSDEGADTNLVRVMILRWLSFPQIAVALGILCKESHITYCLLLSVLSSKRDLGLGVYWDEGPEDHISLIALAVEDPRPGLSSQGVDVGKSSNPQLAPPKTPPPPPLPHPPKPPETLLTPQDTAPRVPLLVAQDAAVLLRTHDSGGWLPSQAHLQANPQPLSP